MAKCPMNGRGHYLLRKATLMWLHMGYSLKEFRVIAGPGASAQYPAKGLPSSHRQTTLFSYSHSNMKDGNISFSHWNTLLTSASWRAGRVQPLNPSSLARMENAFDRVDTMWTLAELMTQLGTRTYDFTLWEVPGRARRGWHEKWYQVDSTQSGVWRERSANMRHLRAGCVAQLAECLPRVPKAPRLILSTKPVILTLGW